MADISVEQKSHGGQQTSWIWALVAFVAVAGLMAWLATRPVITPPVATEDRTATEAEANFGAGGDVVELSDLGMAPESYVGRQVTIRGADVAAGLGSGAFWADVPGANPFLVVLGPAVEGIEVTSGATYDLSGNVEEVTEERIAEWAAAGTINEGARDEASFATHYLLASEARPATGEAAPAAPAAAPAGAAPGGS